MTEINEVNVSLNIQEKIEKGESVSVAEQFEIDIPDDWVCLSIKMNNVSQEVWDTGHDNYMPASVNEFIYEYLLKEQDFYRSVGYHKNGKNKIPHIHINLIYPPTTFPSNLSRDKDKFIKKHDYDKEDFNNFTFKFQGGIDKTKPKYMFLSYPLKEGHTDKDKYSYFYNKRLMSPPEKKLLLDVGTEIYETSLAHNLANDKYEEKKQNEFLEMLRWAKERKEKISSYHDLCLLMDEFVDAKPENKKPCPRTYKSNIQKIGNCLGIFKYSSML